MCSGMLRVKVLLGTLGDLVKLTMGVEAYSLELRRDGGKQASRGMSRYAAYGVMKKRRGNTVTRARFFRNSIPKGQFIFRKEQE